MSHSADAPAPHEGTAYAIGIACVAALAALVAKLVTVIIHLATTRIDPLTQLPQTWASFNLASYIAWGVCIFCAAVFGPAIARLFVAGFRQRYWSRQNGATPSF